MDRIAIFRENILPAGGIETWLYNLGVIYGAASDITVYYGKADIKQVKRLEKLVKLVEYEGQHIECDTAIFSFDLMGHGSVQAKRKIYLIHADYKNFKGNFIAPEDCELYAVSKVAQKSAKKKFGRDVKLLYNPVLPESLPKIYNLVSVTRLSEEKGLLRMRKLAEALDRAGVMYRWDIYAPFVREGIYSPNVVFHKPVMNAISKIKKADFLVQLSDTESFGYSIVESMVVNTGLIVTDLPVLKELNINKNNAIIVPLRAKANWRYDRIVRRILDFRVDGSYCPPSSELEYLDILGIDCWWDTPPLVVVKNTTDFDIWLEQSDIWLEPGRCTVTRNRQEAETTKGVKILT